MLSPGDDATWKRIAQAVPTCANRPLNDTITCLRQATAQQIQDAQDSLGILFPLWPVVDGPGGVIPDRTSKLVREGKFAKLPFIGGTNLDEGKLWY
jgi:carboxylesterase type B